MVNVLITLKKNNPLSLYYFLVHVATTYVSTLLYCENVNSISAPLFKKTKTKNTTTKIF